jgi:hypothetical protein
VAAEFDWARFVNGFGPKLPEDARHSDTPAPRRRRIRRMSPSDAYLADIAAKVAQVRVLLDDPIALQWRLDALLNGTAEPVI